MESLHRNRLIGGGVLLLVGVLFLPSILHPEHKALDNPDLSVHLSNEAKTAKQQQKNTNTIDALAQNPTSTGIVLASADDLVAEKKNQKRDSNVVPISLESSPEPEQTVANQPKQQHLSTWLLIDGFQNDRAALSAANTIEDKHLSTQLRTLSINGKESRQVLVGPFNSNRKMQKAMQTLKTLGHKAKIQR